MLLRQCLIAFVPALAAAALAGAGFTAPLAPLALALAAPSLCPAGFFCADGGVVAPCPAGRFGNTVGASLPQCSGACARGYVCGPGETSAAPAHGMCGRGSVCPAGAEARQPVPAGAVATRLRLVAVPAAGCSAESLAEAAAGAVPVVQVARLRLLAVCLLNVSVAMGIGMVIRNQMEDRDSTSEEDYMLVKLSADGRTVEHEPVYKRYQL
jgi:hypothetical protein